MIKRNANDCRARGSGEHIAGQLHPHEDPAAAEADDHGGEAHELEHDPVEPRIISFNFSCQTK